MVVKTKEELGALREGGKRLAEILQTLAAMVVPGVSTEALENEARRRIERAGDRPAFLGYQPKDAKRPYPAALCVSINDVVVHGIPNESPKIIQSGDIVSLDLGLVHRGLITDAALSLIADKPDPEDARLVRAVHEALVAGIAAARVGNTLGDIGAAIEVVARKYGFDFPRDLGGHAVGRAVHEEPFIANFGPEGSGPELLEGMVLAIEPMMARGSGRVVLDADGYSYKTRDGSHAAHVEHTILVTKDSPEILTQARV